MGLAKGERKSGRKAKQGEVTTLIRDQVAVLAEILCETDFVAQNTKFREYVKAIAERAAAAGLPEGNVADAVKDAEKNLLAELLASVGENIQVRRILRWHPTGKVYSYIHDGGNAKIGVMVEITGEHDADFGKLMAMQIAAASPEYLSPEDVPAAVMAKEREIAAAQPGLAGKPANVVDKIIQGRLDKWMQMTCLTKQIWVHDDKTPVGKVNPKAKVKRFLRWQVGEELPS
jgi:elongation factor Ts